MENKPFGTLLKEARNVSGLSQAKLAEAIEVPRRTIEDWEVNRRTPPSYVQKLILEKVKSLS
jgi:DNA-binding transcriptional regulator YiaG